jgi:hypothetical protein
MKILYYNCFAGISGDMNLGAMIDLGVDSNYLINELKKLEIGPYRIHIEKDNRKSIWGTRVDVILPSEEPYVHEHHHHHGHGHEHGHKHDPNHDYEQNHGGHHHHVTFKDIKRSIAESLLSEGVKKISLEIFMKLAAAEAKIHNHDIDDVAFHEVGAVDSIVDIVGAAICLERLNVEKVFSTPVQVGGGFVKCAHGILPVPAPATTEILRGIPIRSGLVLFETTTPTGAAILAATVDHFSDHVHFIPEKIGYGIGQRDTDVANVLRVVLGEMEEAVSGKGIEVKDS